ncbi:MAG TPA: PQQ-binding-like beta-propeller repeat protein [Pirellulales bacterium]|nr:PQQ-binding-like beta-propeller repeat protein [Pirellulales bacterium]
MTLPTSPSPRRMPIGLIVLVVVGAAIIAGAYFSLPDDNARRFLATAAATGLTVIMLLVWWLFFSGISARTRGRSIAVLAGCIAAFLTLVKLEGCSGNNYPVFAWRWTPKHERPQLDLPSAEGVTIDLSKTTSSDSPQFLGPDRDNQIPRVRLARDWAAHPPAELWRHPLGAGWSSFAVVGDYAVTQEQRGSDELVVCYEKLTGKVCWTHSDTDAFISLIGGDGPRATPTIAGGRVFTMGAKGRLNCLDGATGKAIWSHALLDEHAENFTAIFPEWGKSCSPLVIDDLVIVSTGRPNGHSLEAYDTANGKLVWHAGDALSAYDSPVLTTLAGVRQIVIVNRESVDGHDPNTGEHLWTFEWPGGEPKVPQPVPIEPDKLLVAAGYGLGAKLLKIGHSPGVWSVSPVWSKRYLKPKFTNMVVRDGIAYALDDGSALTCIDLETGNRNWRGGRYGHGQILQAGDLLIVQAESGEVALVDANAEGATELGRFTVFADKTWNEPTLAGRYLLLRNDREAACYELPLAN